MKKLMLLALLLFTVRVKVPFGADETYRHVKSFEFVGQGHMIQLTLSDDTFVLVPSMWTVIEQEIQKKQDKEDK